MPKSCIQELSGPPPTPSSKTQYWNIAMYELRKYRENIEAMYREMGGVKPATPTQALDPVDKISRVAKDGRMAKPHSDHKPQRAEEGGGSPGNQRAHALPISNYLPFSPQLVEVIPSMSESDDGHGNAATLVDSHTPSPAPSSPASEGELQIDDSAWRRKERSPAKPGHTLPAETKTFMGVGRRTQNSLQTVLDNVEMTTPSVTLTTPANPLAPSPNTPLGGLTGFSPGGRCATGQRAKKRGLAVVVSSLSKKLALSGEDGDPEYEEGNHPLFSRCYDNQGKTAIAEIDPEPKRPIRKVSSAFYKGLYLGISNVFCEQVKKPGDTEPSPKKVARAQSLKPSVGTPEPAHSPSPRPLPTSVPSAPPSLPLRVDTPRKDKAKANSGVWVWVCRVLLVSL